MDRAKYSKRMQQRKYYRTLDLDTTVDDDVSLVHQAISESESYLIKSDNSIDFEL